MVRTKKKPVRKMRTTPKNRQPKPKTKGIWNGGVYCVCEVRVLGKKRTRTRCKCGCNTTVQENNTKRKLTGRSQRKTNISGSHRTLDGTSTEKTVEERVLEDLVKTYFEKDELRSAGLYREDETNQELTPETSCCHQQSETSNMEESIDETKE